jgi:hypothetical protein
LAFDLSVRDQIYEDRCDADTWPSKHVCVIAKAIALHTVSADVGLIMGEIRGGFDVAEGGSGDLTADLAKKDAGGLLSDKSQAGFTSSTAKGASKRRPYSISWTCGGAGGSIFEPAI